MVAVVEGFINFNVSSIIFTENPQFSLHLLLDQFLNNELYTYVYIYIFSLLQYNYINYYDNIIQKICKNKQLIDVFLFINKSIIMHVRKMQVKL